MYIKSIYDRIIIFFWYIFFYISPIEYIPLSLMIYYFSNLEYHPRNSDFQIRAK